MDHPTWARTRIAHAGACIYVDTEDVELYVPLSVADNAVVAVRRTLAEWRLSSASPKQSMSKAQGESNKNIFQLALASAARSPTSPLERRLDFLQDTGTGSGVRMVPKTKRLIRLHLESRC